MLTAVPDTSHPPKTSARILLATGEREVRKMVEGASRHAGWNVKTVGDGGSAVAAAQAEPLDLVLLDVVMPEINGLELVRTLRKTPATREVPIVVLAALTGERGQQAALAVGADDYLSRPFTVRELVATVTAHLRVGRLRRESEERFRALVEASAQIVWTTDELGVVREDSPSWRSYTGQTYEEWIGAGWLNALHPEDRGPTAEIWRRASQEGILYEAEYRLYHVASGEYRWMLARGAPLFHPDGTVKGWVGMNTDVHERKRASEEVAESRRFLRSSLDALPSHIAVLDENGVILKVNKSWCHFADANEFQIRDHGVGSSYLAALDADARDESQSREAARGIREVLAGRRREFHLEYPCHTPSAERWFLMTVTRFDSSEPARVVVAHSDVTERVQATRALQAADRRKDAFLAMLSHELRTPLTPVLIAVTGMEADSNLPDPVHEDLAMIRRNVELETKLIDDLLDLSRVLSGKLRLQRETVPLNNVVRQVCDICRSKIREKDLRLHTDWDVSVGLLNADAARIQQVLWNVLSNAAKFTPEGGEIFVATGHAGTNRAFVRVRDTGPGIASDLLPHIFDPFEQANTTLTNQFGGLGLGLAIARALVELHDGTIRAESDGKGRGTTFTIVLPTSPDPLPVKKAPTWSGTPAPELHLRLLVVEDHADTAHTLGRLLRMAGYGVRTAGDAATALALADQESFDVVVSDLGLPDSTGYDLMRRLRERHEIRGIAMSGYGTEEDIRKSREAGFSEHLIKPVSLPQLKEAIRRAGAAPTTGHNS